MTLRTLYRAKVWLAAIAVPLFLVVPAVDVKTTTVDGIAADYHLDRVDS
jgi:hypothetical protein